MKLIKSLLLTLCIFSSVESMDKKRKPEDDPKEKILEKKRKKNEHIKLNNQILQNIAETQEYGYKYANLIELEKLTENFNQQQASHMLKVPIFKGIPSHNIDTFLKKNQFYPANEWKQLVETYLPKKKHQKILTTKTFSKKFEYARAQFETNINKQFQIICEKNLDSFSFNEMFDVKGVDELIEHIKKSGEKLMIRSTGKEDTTELANAGGNHSESNVTPEIKPILMAIQKVVASYFSHKSLMQRLNAGDKTIFDPIIFIPVLIQRMIGETDNQLPTKCGVMFTEEAEGSIARAGINEKKDIIKTTGITIIQCAYGHNEGIVNSLIAADTFYIDKIKNIYPVIRTKTHRMTPQETSGLQLIPNEDTLIEKAVLNKDIIMMLKAFADELEEHYGRPMDVEFVIKEQEKTIYIVQARPITYSKEKTEQPSYLIDFKKNEHLEGSSIGVAGGSVRFVYEAKNILIKEDIRQALAAYQNNREEVPNTDDVEVIIVGKMAPATSHEATTFRSENKPVIYIPEWQKIAEWVKSNNTLVVSPQQGLVVIKDVQLVSVQQGWINYPVPPYVSLIDDFKPMQEIKAITNERLKILTMTAMGLVGKESFSHSWIKIQKETTYTNSLDIIKSLFQKIKFGDQADATASLITLIQKWGSWIEKRKNGHNLDQASLKFLELLSSYTIGYAYNILNVIKYQPIDQNFTRRLLPIHFLESLFWQSPQPDIIDTFSISSFVLEWLGQEQKIAQKFPELGHMTRKFALAKNFALTDELSTQWTEFLQEMKKCEKLDQDAFIQLFLDLSELEVLPLWLHTSFAFKYQHEKNKSKDWAKIIITQCVEEYVQEKNLINILIEKKKIIDSCKPHLFDDPKKFDAQWNIFQKKLLIYFTSEQFCAIFKQKESLGKLVALDVMKKFVDIFDQSIKAVEVTKNIKNVHTMLQSYRDLFVSWINLVKKETITYHPKSPLSDYIKLMDNVLNQEIIQSLTPNMFQASAKFNVTAVTIGNATNIGETIENRERIIAPKTYEDLFTMIHQCLLVTLSGIGKDNNLNTIAIPNLLENVINVCNTLQNQNKIKPTLIGVNIEKNRIDYLYNLSLLNHSAQYHISYDRLNKNVLLKFNFIGRKSSRWQDIFTYIFILGLTKEFTLLSLDQTQRTVSFEVLFTHTSKPSSLATRLQDCIDLTYYDTGYSSETSLAPNITKGLLLELAEDNIEKSLEIIESIMKKNEINKKIKIKFFTEIFIKITKQDQFDKIIKVAIHLSEQEENVEIAQEICKVLVKKSIDVNNIQKIIEKIMLNLFKFKKFSKNSAYYLLEKLIKKVEKLNHQLQEKIIAMASDQEIEFKKNGLKLLKKLVEKDQCFQESLKIAIQVLKQTSSEQNSYENLVYSNGLKLMRALLEKEQGTKKFKKIAHNKFLNKNSQDDAIELFTIFFDTIQKGYKQALITAKEASTNPDLQNKVLDLIDILKENEDKQKKIKEVVESILSDESINNDFFKEKLREKINTDNEKSDENNNEYDDQEEEIIWE